MILRMGANNNCLIVHFLQASTPSCLSAVFLVYSHYNFLNSLSKPSRAVTSHSSICCKTYAFIFNIAVISSDILKILCFI